MKFVQINRLMIDLHKNFDAVLKILTTAIVLFKFLFHIDIYS